MRYFLLLLLGSGSLLVSCNLTGASSEVAFTNPFGLDKQLLRLSRSGEETSVTWQGSFKELPIVDETSVTLKIPDLYKGLTPGRLLERLGFETEMIATSKAGKPEDFPETFTFSAPQLELKIVDGDGVTSVTSNLTSKGTLEVVYSNKDCSESTVTETSCTYKTTSSDAVLGLEYGGADFKKFFNDILTAGQSPNLLSATFTMTVKGTGGLLGFPPSDTEARLVLKSSDGKLVF